MLKGDRLGPKENVVSYVSGGKIDDGVVNGEAFIRRPGDNDGLSVNWLEYFEGGRAVQVREITRLALGRLTVRKTGAFAELPVGALEEALADVLETFSCAYEPLEAEGEAKADPSHCLLLGLPSRADNPELAQIVGDIISSRVAALHPPALDS